MEALTCVPPKRDILGHFQYSHHSEEHFVIPMKKLFIRNIHVGASVGSDIPVEDLLDCCLREVDYDWHVWDNVKVGDTRVHCTTNSRVHNDATIKFDCPPPLESLTTTTNSQKRELTQEYTSYANYLIQPKEEIIEEPNRVYHVEEDFVVPREDLFKSTLRCVDYDWNVCDDTIVYTNATSCERHDVKKVDCVSARDVHSLITPKEENPDDLPERTEAVEAFRSRQCLVFEDDKEELFNSNLNTDYNWNGRDEVTIVPIKRELIVYEDNVELQQLAQFFEPKIEVKSELCDDVVGAECTHTRNASDHVNVGAVQSRSALIKDECDDVSVGVVGSDCTHTRSAPDHANVGAVKSTYALTKDECGDVSVDVMGADCTVKWSSALTQVNSLPRRLSPSADNRDNAEKSDIQQTVQVSKKHYKKSDNQLLKNKINFFKVKDCFVKLYDILKTPTKIAPEQSKSIDKEQKSSGVKNWHVDAVAEESICEVTRQEISKTKKSVTATVKCELKKFSESGTLKKQTNVKNRLICNYSPEQSKVFDNAQKDSGVMNWHVDAAAEESICVVTRQEISKTKKSVTATVKCELKKFNESGTLKKQASVKNRLICNYSPEQRKVFDNAQKDSGVKNWHVDAVAEESICDGTRQEVSKTKKSVMASVKSKLKKCNESETLKQQKCIKKNRLICDYCKKEFDKRKSFVKHIKIHRKNKQKRIKKNMLICDYCEKEFDKRRPFIYHIKTHGEKPFSCQTCEYRCILKGTLAMHVKTHTGEKPHSCHYCGYKFLTKSKLIRHIKTHTGERPYSCELCCYRFVTRTHLVRHMLTHTGQRPYSCELCQYRSVQKYHLIRHMRKHAASKT